ncbi:hypothetical protein [Actinomadura luteofluorescens]|uniref:hypothetical protein n=1 Tax=Actinomadura luteofluorescens TaxID=46163 RepID=UPI003D937F23
MIETALYVVEAASVRWVAVFDLAVGLGALTGGVTGDSNAGFGGSAAGLGMSVARVAIVI